jgi:DNA-binding NarL/FixJ family response regulator
MDIISILHAVTSKIPSIAVLSLNSSASLPETVMILRRFHLTHPAIPKILLVDSCDRDLVVSAFRSGARGIFSITDANLRLLCKCLLRVAAGQIWANAEQLNYVMDLLRSSLPARPQLPRQPAADAARGTSRRPGRGRLGQPSDRQ